PGAAAAWRRNHSAVAKSARRLRVWGQRQGQCKGPRVPEDQLCLQIRSDKQPPERYRLQRASPGPARRAARGLWQACHGRDRCKVVPQPAASGSGGLAFAWRLHKL
ncbi:hypothetical protein LPJ70_005289, partial [Coemansia sp. RSA 2708]